MVFQLDGLLVRAECRLRIEFPEKYLGHLVIEGRDEIGSQQAETVRRHFAQRPPAALPAGTPVAQPPQQQGPHARPAIRAAPRCTRSRTRPMRRPIATIPADEPRGEGDLREQCEAELSGQKSYSGSHMRRSAAVGGRIPVLSARFPACSYEPPRCSPPALPAPRKAPSATPTLKSEDRFVIARP